MSLIISLDRISGIAVHVCFSPLCSSSIAYLNSVNSV
jgi:hypothetical protein